MSARDELLEILQDGEVLEAVTFGDWGWGGFNEPNPPIITQRDKWRVLTPEEALPLMVGWDISGGFGSPECYDMTAWTNLRVIWIHEYDGSTCLQYATRNPSQMTDPGQF